MKRNIINILKGVVGTAFAAILYGCAAENPFDTTEGTGTVRVHAVMNSVTTRADETSGTELSDLEKKCVVYITRTKAASDTENSKTKTGLIKKWVGLDNIEPNLTLSTGEYLAEAWSGDSVTASYNAMFYRGKQPFTVKKGSNDNVVVNCKIQNVVVSVEPSSIDPNVLNDDYKITVKNSRGSLHFDKNNIATDKIYFMMPNGDTKLEYEITGSTKDGKEFSKKGIVKDVVERAHHYILNFKFGEGEGYDDGMGGVFFKITIADENLEDVAVVQVPTAPTVSGVEFNIAKQLNYSTDDKIPADGVMLKVCAFGQGIDEITVSSASASEMGLPTQPFNVYAMDANFEAQCREAGLSWTAPEYKASSNVSTAYLIFPKSLLQKLTAKESEHVITIGAKDKKAYTSETQLRIARSESAIVVEDPIVVEAINTDANPMAVTGTTATIDFTLADEYEGEPGVEYSKEDSDTWTFVKANVTRAAKKYAVTITGLEPGTRYRYRAACGDFHSEDVMYLTTEEKFVIPYANMETWNAFTITGKGGCTLPGTAANEFWGNGNPGSMTMGVTLTQGSTDIFHSGQTSAKLKSQFVGVGVLGKFAAGNLFAGEYKGTDGTDGILEFGRAYNGSHPKSLKVWANYRPGTVDKTSDSAPEIVKGGLDIGQIYIALTTKPIEIRTKNASKLFNPNDPEVIAYGEYTFNKENFGEDGQLKELEIKFNYYDAAKTIKPTHLVIVCSASKFGDYFCGGEGSTMYLDDFELIY